MAELTPSQRKWLLGVQKALNAPGSEGLAFATGGDSDLIVYEGGHEEEMQKYRHDPIILVNEKDWQLASLYFPDNVEGWCI